MKLDRVAQATGSFAANTLLDEGWQLISVDAKGIYHFGRYEADSDDQVPDWTDAAAEFLASMDPNAIDQVVLEQYRDEGLTAGVLKYLIGALKGAV